MLWLSGSAGVGKSVLTRALMEDVMARSPQIPLPNGTVVLHFFCTYSDASFNSEETVLRSLLHQCVQIVPRSDSIVSSRLQIRTRWGLEYSTERERLWVALEEVLSMNIMINALVVLDAVEELPVSAAMNILHGFYSILQSLNQNQPNHRVRIYLSSRPIPAYRNTPPGIFVLHLQHHHFKESINKYVIDNVSQFNSTNQQFRQVTSEAKRSEISSKIAERADGMFLWAEIAWLTFKQGLLWTNDVINEKLRQLDETPPGLNSLYDTLLNRVETSNRKDMWTILSIIAAAEEPLTPRELEIFIGISMSTKSLVVSADIHIPQNIEEIIEDNFPDLVRIGDDGRIKFIHLSFKEYLERYWADKNPETRETFRHTVAKCCLLYLKLEDLLEQLHQNKSIYSKLAPRVKSHPPKLTFRRHSRQVSAISLCCEVFSRPSRKDSPRRRPMAHFCEHGPTP
jgi:hypothetical protein